uniref:Uncharacterized protein n=1 Tax=Panagrolaimus sp. JU765 TaxID=591449 RepID=A0AC34QHC8_9BILA
MFVLYWLNVDPTMKRIFKVCMNFVVNLYAISFVHVTFKSNETWKTQLYRIIKCRKQLHVSNTVTNPRTSIDFVKNSKGKQMIFLPEQEIDLYFQQLKSTW